MSFISDGAPVTVEEEAKNHGAELREVFGSCRYRSGFAFREIRIFCAESTMRYSDINTPHHLHRFHHLHYLPITHTPSLRTNRCHELLTYLSIYFPLLSEYIHSTSWNSPYAHRSNYTVTASPTTELNVGGQEHRYCTGLSFYCRHSFYQSRMLWFFVFIHNRYIRAEIRHTQTAWIVQSVLQQRSPQWPSVGSMLQQQCHKAHYHSLLVHLIIALSSEHGGS
jgi:hypothetical protein